MLITDFERKQIEKEAMFLTKFGYVKSDEPYSVKYSLNNICINIIFPPNSEESDIDIHFIEKNKVFSVGWIAFVREGIRGNEQKLFYIKTLLHYIEKNYFQLVDFRFCEESEGLIEKYVEENYKEFEKAIQSFLNNN